MMLLNAIASTTSIVVLKLPWCIPLVAKPSHLEVLCAYGQLGEVKQFVTNSNVS